MLHAVFQVITVVFDDCAQKRMRNCYPTTKKRIHCDDLTIEAPQVLGWFVTGSGASATCDRVSASNILAHL
jgi:hypothetical protein